MNKSELIADISTRAGITREQAQQALDATLEGLSEALAKGTTVTLSGFGTFEAVERAAREARNPQTGEKVMVAARKVVRFRPGKGLKDSVA